MSVPMGDIFSNFFLFVNVMTIVHVYGRYIGFKTGRLSEVLFKDGNLPKYQVFCSLTTSWCHLRHVKSVPRCHYIKYGKVD